MGDTNTKDSITRTEQEPLQNAAEQAVPQDTADQEPLQNASEQEASETAAEQAPGRGRRKVHMRKVKRNRKLLVQVGAIVIAIFLVVIMVMALILAKGYVKSYLKSKEEYMRPLANRQKVNFDLLPGLGWFFDTWEENKELTEIYIDSSTEDPLYEEMVKTFPKEEENSTPTFDLESIQAAPQRAQRILAAYIYSDFYMEQLLSFALMENISSMTIDVSDEHWGTMIMMAGDLFQDTELVGDYNSHMGEDYSSLLNDLEEVKAVREKGQPVFRRYDSGKDGKYYYLYITPIWDTERGEIRAVHILMYDWSNFHADVMNEVLLIVGISAMVLTLAAVLLLYFINRSAIRPLGRVQRGVREYMVTKDSWRAYEHMKDIIQRNEFGALADDVTRMAVEIDRYTEEVTKLTGERERVETELALAADIQKGFLPEDFPTVNDYELYASMDPAKEVGGDLYDFFDIDETHVGLVIGDVSGKGVPAALFMMIAKVLIREYAKSSTSPAEVLAKTNETLCANNKHDMFVTAWFGILDRTTGKVVATSAGHEFPILRKAGEDFQLIKDRHGFVLGGMEMTRYREYELELGQDGILLVYTDGAAEATNADMELFGTDRMLEALNTHECRHPQEVVEALSHAIDAFVGTAPQFDDLTMLCVKYNG